MFLVRRNGTGAVGPSETERVSKGVKVSCVTGSGIAFRRTSQFGGFKEIAPLSTWPFVESNSLSYLMFCRFGWRMHRNSLNFVLKVKKTRLRFQFSIVDRVLET